MRRLVWLVLIAACRRQDARSEVVLDPAPSSTAPPPAPPTSKACASHAECSFDDPCMPAECVPKASAKPPAACEESAPKPGLCLCVSGTCTLRRSDPKTGAKKVGCKANAACAFQARSGSCAGAKASPTVVIEGGFCSCSDGVCTPEWVEKVPCTSNADCSWLRDPYRPVSSSKEPRPPGKPCAGYERSAECKAGVCTMSSWSC